MSVESPVKYRCGYCGGAPDHKHGTGHACGDCCAMHGFLTHDPELKDAYKWVAECFNKHVDTLNELETLQVSSQVASEQFKQYKQEVKYNLFGIPSILLLFVGIGSILFGNLRIILEVSLPSVILALILMFIASSVYKDRRSENNNA